MNIRFQFLLKGILWLYIRPKKRTVMKRICLTGLMVIIACCCVAQNKNQNETRGAGQISTTKTILDSIITLAKENSLYAGNVNWDDLEKEIMNKFKDNDSLSS